MKLFGNSRRRADRPRRSYRETESAAPREEMPSRTEPVQRAPRPTPQPSQRYVPQPRPVQPPETNPEPQQEGRLSGKTKGMLYVAAASLLLLGAIIMCIVLIARSKVLPPLPTVQTDGTTVGNVETREPSATEEIPTMTQEPAPSMQEPTSRNDSKIYNVLLVGYNSKTGRNDQVIVLNFSDGYTALTALPRDTYISGNYDDPRLSSVMKESATTERGLRKVCEAVEGMFGFKLDYYVMLDETAMQKLVDRLGGVDFDVPTDITFTDAWVGGNSHLNAEQAAQFLCYKESYDVIETESTKTCLDFVAALLKQAVSGRTATQIAEDIDAVLPALQTDMPAEVMRYFADAFSRANLRYCDVLQGEKVTDVDNNDFYQIDPEGAAMVLNASFNPLEKELTTYELNFRQREGNSTDGTYSDYGFGQHGNNDGTTAPTQTPDPTDPTEPDPPTEGPEPTEPPTPDPTDPPTPAPPTPDEP